MDKAHTLFGKPVVALALLCVLVLPQSVHGQVSVGLGGGANLCLPNGDADCEDIYPFGYVNAAFDYRFLTYASVGIDYNYSGLLTRRSDATVSAQHAVLMVRGHIPFTIEEQSVRVAVGFGSGYGEIWASHTDIDEPFYSFFSPFATLRVDGSLLFETPWSLEFGPEAVWVGYFHGERCFVHPLGQSDCAATSDLDGGASDVIDLFQLGVTGRYVF